MSNYYNNEIIIDLENKLTDLRKQNNKLISKLEQHTEMLNSINKQGRLSDSEIEKFYLCGKKDWSES